MKKVSLPVVAAVLSMAAIPAFAQGVAPGPDIHFKGPQGEIVRGVRCAAEKVAPEVQSEVDRVLAEARASGRPPGDLTIPVVFHVIHNGPEGNIPASMINAQMSVLNQAFQGTGFSFTGLDQPRGRPEWFTNCYGNQNFKRDLAVDGPTP